MKMFDRSSSWKALMIAVFGVILIVFFASFRFALAHAPIEERILALTKRIEQDPKNAELYLTRGELYRTHREWSASQADFKHAAELDPDLAEVDLYLGKMFLASDRPEQAEVVLQRFLVQIPDHPEARVTLAQVLLKVGRRVEAAKEYNRAIELHPNPDAELYLERAKALIWADSGNLNEALRGLDQGLQRLGQVVTLQLYAIDLEIRQERFDAAITRLEQIAAQSSRKEVWLVRRGEILKKAGRFEGAHKAFEGALAAIQKLPVHRQRTQAMIQLEARVRDSLNRLDSLTLNTQEKGEDHGNNH